MTIVTCHLLQQLTVAFIMVAMMMLLRYTYINEYCNWPLHVTVCVYMIAQNQNIEDEMVGAAIGDSLSSSDCPHRPGTSGDIIK